MADNDDLLDYEDEEQTEQPIVEGSGDTAPRKVDLKGTYVSIHSSGFRDFLLKPEILRAIVDCGFEHPSEVQHECIPQAVLGMDILCQAKSGMGKTAVFVLATLQQMELAENQVTVLVMCHTRELAFQISKEYERFSKYMPNIKVAVFFGGLPIQKDEEVLKNNCPHIVVGTPGRILALVKNKKLNLKNLKHFVLDECDKMLEQLDMRRDVQEIFRNTPHSKQVMMFSATLSKDIRPVCKKFMQDPMEVYVDDEAKLTLHGLQQHYVKLKENEKNKKLFDLLDILEFNQVVIFVKSVQRCMALAQLLCDQTFTLGNRPRSVIQCLRNTGISLPWLDGDSLTWRVLRNFYNYLVFLIVVYHLIIAIMSAVLLPDFDGKCRAGALISVTSNPTVISIYYALYHKRIQKFFEHSDNLNQQILDSELGETEYFKTIYLKSAKKINVLTVSIVMFIFMTPIIYNIPRPIIEIYYHEYRKTQPLYLYYPFDVHLPGSYEVTFLLQTLSLLCGDIKKFANDCFFLAMFRAQTVYLKYLSASIKDLGEQFKTSDNVVIRRKMINWINLHDQFIRNFNELMDLYTPVICIYKVNLICIVVLCIFTQLQDKKYGWIEGSGFAGFFLANIFQLYLQCETNDDFSVEAENLSLEIYKTPWYEIDKTNKDMLKTTLLMASRPVEITAFNSPMLKLNKETFLAFVGSTITAVMTIKEMSDLRQ